MSKNVDLSSYQVIINKPIWLSGRIWEPNVYDNPPAILVKCAEECHADENAVIYFGTNGKRVNPFAKATMVNLEPEADMDPTGDDGVGDLGAVEPEDETNGVDPVVDSDEIDFVFATPEDFAAMPKAEQNSYVDSIRGTPDTYDEAESDEYEKDLYVVLKEYEKVVTSSKAKATIKEVLAEYSE